MENEIKVGEYIRTKLGNIAKVIEFRDELILDTVIKFNGMYQKFLNDDELDFIVKHSPNLIDLIEVGDYVNGEIVTEIKEWNSSKDGYFRYAVTCHYEIIRADEIKTVVTKEQFESISYKVKE